MILCRDINGKAHVVAKTSLVKRTSVYGVIRSKKGILLVRDRTSSDKKWDLPGGGIEPKERLLDGLKREIKEETGLDVIGRPHKNMQIHRVLLRYQFRARMGVNASFL